MWSIFLILFELCFHASGTLGVCRHVVIYLRQAAQCCIRSNPTGHFIVKTKVILTIPLSTSLISSQLETLVMSWCVKLSEIDRPNKMQLKWAVLIKEYFGVMLYYISLNTTDLRPDARKWISKRRSSFKTCENGSII